MHQVRLTKVHHGGTISARNVEHASGILRFQLRPAPKVFVHLDIDDPYKPKRIQFMSKMDRAASLEKRK
jgi:hypothetical protein